MNELRIKLTVSVIAGALLIARLVWPSLRIDAVALGLVVVLILPWLSSLIKSAEFPGGWKVEFQDVRAAGEKVTQGTSPISSASVSATRPSYLQVADQDPNLALVGLRIEIESRLQALAEKNGISTRRGLRATLYALIEKNVIHPAAAEGLHELIRAGNEAAHGAKVDDRTAKWALEYGPVILETLDHRVSTGDTPTT